MSQPQFCKCMRYRCKSPEEKLAYLHLTGLSGLKSILNVEMDILAIEGILEALEFGQSKKAVDAVFSFGVLDIIMSEYCHKPTFCRMSTDVRPAAHCFSCMSTKGPSTIFLNHH